MKLQLTNLLLLICIVTSAQHLIFKSSFEEGVYLDEPFYDDITSGTWWQNLQGSDVDGFSWPINLWNGEGVFQVLVDADLPNEEYIQNNLEIVNDENGEPTRVIHQKIIQKAAGYTQNPYIIYTETEDGDLYVKYKIKFTEDLKTILGPDGWLTFFEWKTSGDYRIAAYIYEDLEENLYWYVHGDNEANGGLPYEQFWYEEDYTIPVPEGEWFTTEFFWHRSTENDGRFWWSVNGHVIADYIGPNKNIEPIDRIMLFTAYSSSDSIEQWVDDIEVWDDFPCGNGIPCYNNTTISINDNLLSSEKLNFIISPNPSNTIINLKYDLLEQSRVNVKIYTTQGQLIKCLIDKEQSSGHKNLNIDLKNVMNGVYFCKLSIEGKKHLEKTIKLVIKNN